MADFALEVPKSLIFVETNSVTRQLSGFDDKSPNQIGGGGAGGQEREREGEEDEEVGSRESKWMQ